MPFPRLKPNEKRTFILHTAYSSIEGIVLGIMALNEFVFLKSMHGSNYQMSLLFQFSMAVFILLFVMHEWLKRMEHRMLLLRKTAVFTRLPMLTLAFFPSHAAAYTNSSFYHYVFLAIFLIYYLGALVINPTINLLLKNNYEHHHFGKLYSYATSLNKIIMLVITFVYGALLDQNYYIFKWSLPLAGLLSMIGLWLLSTISFKEKIIQFKQN